MTSSICFDRISFYKNCVCALWIINIKFVKQLVTLTEMCSTRVWAVNLYLPALFLIQGTQKWTVTPTANIQVVRVIKIKSRCDISEHLSG